jgi:hypothetical protein
MDCTFAATMLRAGNVQTLTEQLSSLEASSAELDKSLKQLQEEHSKVSMQLSARYSSTAASNIDVDDAVINQQRQCCIHCGSLL